MLIKKIPDWSKLPYGYRPVYYDASRQESWTVPFGLHYIFMLCYWIWEKTLIRCPRRCAESHIGQIDFSNVQVGDKVLIHYDQPIYDQPLPGCGPDITIEKRNITVIVIGKY